MSHGPMCDVRCGRCGYRCRVDEDLEDEKLCCPTCGEKLHVQVRTLVDSDESDSGDLFGECDDVDVGTDDV